MWDTFGTPKLSIPFPYISNLYTLFGISYTNMLPCWTALWFFQCSWREQKRKKKKTYPVQNVNNPSIHTNIVMTFLLLPNVSKATFLYTVMRITPPPRFCCQAQPDKVNITANKNKITGPQVEWAIIPLAPNKFTFSVTAFKWQSWFSFPSHSVKTHSFPTSGKI